MHKLMRRYFLPITFPFGLLIQPALLEYRVKTTSQGGTGGFGKVHLFCLMTHLCLVCGKNEVVLSHCGPGYIQRYLEFVIFVWL